MLNDLLEEHDALEARIASYTDKIDEQMTPWEEQLRLLTTIPGIDVSGATGAPSRRVSDLRFTSAIWAGGEFHNGGLS